MAQQRTTIPRLPKDIPPGFEEILPVDVVQRLKNIHENSALTAEQQHQQIDEVMTSLPEELLNRLPPPPGFDRLPLPIRDELKRIHRDKKLNWRQRHDKIREIIDTLPSSSRSLPTHKGVRLTQALLFVVSSIFFSILFYGRVLAIFNESCYCYTISVCSSTTIFVISVGK